jgi:uncharacterized delta-60 repeat protein
MIYNYADISANVNSSIPLITPAYGSMELTLDASVADYIDLDIYIGDASKALWSDGDLRTLRFLGTSTTVNIQGIIQSFFSSDASANIDFKRFDLKGHRYVNNIDSSFYIDKFYAFNGVDRGFKSYNYIFDGSVNAKFLNNWNTDINVHYGDTNIPLYFFQGIFENSTGRYDVSTASFRILKDGSTYNLDIGLINTDFNSFISKIAFDSNNDLYAVGNFTSYRDTSAMRMIKLDSDLIKDISFDACTGFNAQIYDAVIDTNNKIYVAGNFTSYRDVSAMRLTKLNSDGSRDTTFNVSNGFNGIVNKILLDSSNRIYACGQFTSYRDSSAMRLVRINSDGTRDTTYDTSTGFNDTIYSIVLDASNRLYAAGAFSSYKNASQNYLIKLNSDSTKDTTFNIGTGFNNYTSIVAIDHSNKLFVGGGFTAYKDTSRNSLVRLGVDGSIDTTFDACTGFNDIPEAITFNTNNQLYVGGGFTTYWGLSQKGLIRLNSNGTKDTTFNIGSGFNNEVFSIVLFDNKIYVGGNFTTVQGLSYKDFVILDTNGNIYKDTTPKIYKLNVDKDSLNALVPTLNINANTTSYSIDPSRNTSSIYRKTIKIIPKDNRYTPKKVSWVDSMGCINSFNFDLVQVNEVNVDKQTYLNNGILKQFNNEVEDAYTITSNWITEEESLALKDLWYTPSVIIDGKYAIIQTKKTEIKKRRTDRLINYTLEYILANEYKIQVN